MKGFDRSRWPIPLATAEDYERACTEFVKEYLAEAAVACSKHITELNDLLENSADEKLSQEIIDIHVEKVKAASSFPQPINDFLQEVAALEHKLEAEGAFTNEES